VRARCARAVRPDDGEGDRDGHHDGQRTPEVTRGGERVQAVGVLAEVEELGEEGADAHGILRFRVGGPREGGSSRVDVFPGLGVAKRPVC